MVKPQHEVKPYKIEAVEALKGKFTAAKGIVLADFTGITVEEANDLRRRCREAEVEYRVVKNTIARIAARESNLEELEGHFDGPIAVAMSSADSVAPARVLASFRREVQKLTFRAGYVEGRVYAPEEIREIAMLPPREGLLARVIGAVEAPLSHVMWSIEGILRDLVSVIDQASKKAEGSA
jgi:large subunit ribosomal protein L10